MSVGRTGGECLTAGIAALRAVGIDAAASDARRLLAHALEVDAGRLTLVLPDTVPAEMAAGYDRMIARRVAREPVSHIVGMREFFGRRFAVNADVLDPRPETETLVETGLRAAFRDVLDLGTGSGCVLLTLLAERAGARGVGVDLSQQALIVARHNAGRLGLTDRADFVRSDWFSAVVGRFDLIVANPPYVAADEMAGLDPEVRLFEPRMALTDERSGLSAYHVIASQAERYLRPHGLLAVEHGVAQAAAVRAIFRAARWRDVASVPDLDGRDRLVTARAPA